MVRERVKTVKREELFILFPVFQKGVRMKIPNGCSLKSLLHDVWKIPSDTIENKIATIFLDGKPVDDIESATIKDGSVLALSSAMPGLVGAAMRRGGYFSTLRDSITFRGDGNIQISKEGLITVKLFNLLIKELGPVLLRIGFEVDAGELKGFKTDSDQFDDGSRVFVKSID